jgi:hypothetical protein
MNLTAEHSSSPIHKIIVPYLFPAPATITTPVRLRSGPDKRLQSSHLQASLLGHALTGLVDARPHTIVAT